MLHVGKKGQWLALTGLAIVLAVGGLSRVYLRPSANGGQAGQVAYEHGDWETAASLARASLKVNGNDVAAWRLLARSLVRMGCDSAAMTVYHRLGPEAMFADDLCLLGVALTRSGNSRGVEVWEQARAADPNHAETLFELTRAYAMDDQLSRATETARRLASRPGWQRPAEMLLGNIQLKRNDPAGAIVHWQRALEFQARKPDGTAAPIALRKDLARALLRTKQPAEARRHLQIVLRAEPDPEAFWLLSRAYLQEGAQMEALAAWEKASPFREEHPLDPEPAPFVGSASCAGCHPAVYRAQQASRHARTFFRGTELGSLEVPARSFPDPNQPAVVHTLKRMDDGRIQQETRVGDQLIRAVAEYAFGSGDRGLTLIGRDDRGQPCELRLSYYLDGTDSCWGITSGHPRNPSEPAGYLGRLLSDDGVRRCFSCHVTDPRAVEEGTSPLAADRGIGCEGCHGPGGSHERAIRAGFPDLAIARPTIASSARIVMLCAQCHSPRGQTVLRDDPVSVRFQGITLTWSRCFSESNDTLDCTTCHDPHQNVVTSSAHYEARCLSCHAGAARSGTSLVPPQRARLAETAPQRACPVDPEKGCIACHMPAVKNVIPHTSFTDHFIRIHRK
jgi:tetratricopeptide (TPR) repeat protein